MWTTIHEFTDIKYERTDDGIAKITINRPEVRNAFRPLTVAEMKDALDIARDDADIGVIILTGEGPDAFCSGGDQRVRGKGGYVDPKEKIPRLNILDVQKQIRSMPKPVVAMDAGYAIGGGAAVPEGGDECGLRPADRSARFRRRRDAALLPERRGAGRTQRIRREAEAGLQEVPSIPVNAWIVAARPKTLSAAVVPVMVGAALLRGPLHWPLLACTLTGALLIQIPTNYINHALDFRKGPDTRPPLEP